LKSFDSSSFILRTPAIPGGSIFRMFTLGFPNRYPHDREAIPNLFEGFGGAAPDDVMPRLDAGLVRAGSA